MAIKQEVQVNMTVEFNELIKKLKEWTKANFYFNNNTVYYLNPDHKYLGNLPDGLNIEGVEYDNSLFDTPLSHLMYALIEIGKHQQIKISEQALRLYCKEISEQLDDARVL